MHSLSPISPTDLFVLTPSVGTRGHQYNIQVQHCHTEAQCRFFTYRMINALNLLSPTTVSAFTLNIFKYEVQAELGSTLYEHI